MYERPSPASAAVERVIIAILGIGIPVGMMYAIYAGFAAYPPR